MQVIEYSGKYGINFVNVCNNNNNELGILNTDHVFIPHTSKLSPV